MRDNTNRIRKKLVSFDANTQRMRRCAELDGGFLTLTHDRIRIGKKDEPEEEGRGWYDNNMVGCMMMDARSVYCGSRIEN